MMMNKEKTQYPSAAPGPAAGSRDAMSGQPPPPPPLPSLLLLPFMLLLLVMVVPALAHAQETMTQNLEGGMDITITYPDSIAAGRDGTVSILVSNNGWEDKQEISMEFEPPGMTVLEVVRPPSGRIDMDRLAQGGSYGHNLLIRAAQDAVPGTHFLNIRYSHVLVANNQDPQEPIFHDMAIPITVKGLPDIDIYVRAPESIFADAEFLFDVEVASPDVQMTDVTVRIIPPEGTAFGGETMHSFSRLDAGTPVAITARITTPADEVTREHRLPFTVIVEYTDDTGDRKTDSQTVPTVLRPRTFMELTTDGGIWIGGFFIAPYVSLGTIIGIPAGLIVSLLVRRRTGGKRGTRRQGGRKTRGPAKKDT